MWAMHTPHNYALQLLLDLDWLQYEVHIFFKKNPPLKLLATDLHNALLKSENNRIHTVAMMMQLDH